MTGVQTCALPICHRNGSCNSAGKLNLCVYRSSGRDARRCQEAPQVLMFIRLSKRIVRHCCKGEGSDENELYIFGVNQFLNMLLNILTALFIGILFGETFQIILFMLAYIPLRSYAGGWHSRTPLRCYIFSVIMLIVVSIGMKYLSVMEWMYYVILAVAMLVVFVLSPIEDRNRPLDEIEHKVYKRRTILIAAAELLFGIMLKLTKFDTLFVAVVYSFAVLSLMLVAGKVKNRY